MEGCGGMVPSLKLYSKPPLFGWYRPLKVNPDSQVGVFKKLIINSFHHPSPQYEDKYCSHLCMSEMLLTYRFLWLFFSLFCKISFSHLITFSGSEIWIRKIPSSRVLVFLNGHLEFFMCLQYKLSTNRKNCLYKFLCEGVCLITK